MPLELLRDNLVIAKEDLMSSITFRNLRAKLCFVLCVALAPQMLWGQAAPESAVREAIVSRLEALQSIIVEYDAEHSFFPRGSLSDAPGMHIKTGTDRSNERYLYHKGNARWEKTLTKETV